MKVIVRYALVLCCALSLEGCFSSDKPLIYVGSSEYLPAIEGAYYALDGNVGESEEVDEDASVFHVAYIKNLQMYLCSGGDESFLFDIQKVTADFYLLQSTLREPEGDGPENPQYFLALFKRMENGYLTMVMPEEKDAVALLQEFGISAEMVGERVFELQATQPAQFINLIRKMINVDLTPMNMSYLKVSTD